VYRTVRIAPNGFVTENALYFANVLSQQFFRLGSPALPALVLLCAVLPAIAKTSGTIMDGEVEGAIAETDGAKVSMGPSTPAWSP
jgi:hypothetical protein